MARRRVRAAAAALTALVAAGAAWVITASRDSLLAMALDGESPGLASTESFVRLHVEAGSVVLGVAFALLFIGIWLTRRHPESADVEAAEDIFLGLGATCVLLAAAGVGYGIRVGALLPLLPRVGEALVLADLRADLVRAGEQLSAVRWVGTAFILAVGAWRVKTCDPMRRASASSLVIAAAVFVVGAGAFALTRAHAADTSEPRQLVATRFAGSQIPPGELPIATTCERRTEITACDSLSVGDALVFDGLELSRSELSDALGQQHRNRRILGRPPEPCLVFEAASEPARLREPLRQAARHYTRFYLLMGRERTIRTATLGATRRIEQCGVRFHVDPDRGVDPVSISDRNELARRVGSGQLTLRVGAVEH